MKIADEVSELYATLIPDAEHEVPEAVDQLKILVWNIWHGGHRFGENVGVQRVIDIIKSSNADIIGLIETYGSGEEIADSLGYYFYLISTNLSIMSRYPITETIKAFRPFNFGGAKLNLGNGKEMAFFDTWLHYLPDYAKHIVERSMTSEELVADESKTRHSEIKHILKEIKPYLKNADNVPVILLGDFNSGSHLDWIEETKGTRMSEVRIDHVQETGAEIVATACPYCMQMLEDAIGSKGVGETLKDLDIAEMVAMSMEL